MIENLTHTNGIIELRLNHAVSEHNIMDAAAITALAAAVRNVTEDPSVSGIIVSSAKKTFVAGGDINELLAANTPEKVIALVSENMRCLRQLETAGKPVVAIIDGAALGGGLELALACHYRIVSNRENVLLGLPEVGLGLMPGAGGTQRLPYLVGVKAALEIILYGTQLRAQRAKDLGLVDEIVPTDHLLDAAIERLIAGAVPSVQPWDRAPFNGAIPDPTTEEGRDLIGRNLKRISGRAAENEPAPAAIVTAMAAGLRTNMDEALRIEQRHFAQIGSGRVAKDKIRTLFFGVNAARNMKSRHAGVTKYQIHKVGVIGAGLMGSGIAHASARAGYDVVLIDVSDDAAAKGRESIGRKCAAEVTKGRMLQEVADALVARIQATHNYRALADVDIVVEAVPELRKVKDDVNTKVSAIVKPGVPLATNTSTLPISTLATATRRPEDFIGLHFFAPVDRMQFVEVIKGDETSDTTLARALDFIAGLRKVAIVVGDGLGFFTSRVVGAYTGEALTLLAEGVDPTLVDDVAIRAGMPLGPLAMADMTSLSLLKDIFVSLQGDGNRQGMKGMRALEALHRMVDKFDRSGRASGRGIYDYHNGKPVPWPELRNVFPRRAQVLDAETIEKRLLYVQALETARAVEEGVVANATDADVGSVLAWAFPSFTGGVLSYVDRIGVKRFVAQCDDLTEIFGGRFEPPTLLRDMAVRGERFHQ
jgi:3-hydroxyacyl-CoA dehydrogenase/enoyl-CoA hydratase/3-hydroxybutyryl-CoA epimerase